MYYSCISILSLILLLIINRDALWKNSAVTEREEAVRRVAVRYRHFLITAILYFITDIAWGILYEHHDISKLFPILYSDAVFYFIFMFLTMLTWTRYVVAYIDKKRRRSIVLLYSV